jgi:hypothetical protein
MSFADAKALCIQSASDADLARAWHSYASAISYHHADDSGREWGMASKLAEQAREIEREIRRRGEPRPEGQYLMSKGERIDWETGHWSPGWDWKKARAAQVQA